MTKVTAEVKDVKVSKTARAVEIVRAAFQARLDAVNAKTPEDQIPSARSVAIANIKAELFPGEAQQAAANTYYDLAYRHLLTEGNEAAQAALAKGKSVYSVFRTHRTKAQEGQYSMVGLVTSKAAANQLKKFLCADGVVEGVAQVVKGVKAKKAA